jgi:acyl-CoA thioesterase FadM
MIGFYVNVFSQGRNALLRGPFDTYEEAEAAIPATSRQAQRYDRWLHFGDWGVAKLKAPRLIQGRLDFLESMRAES